MSCWQTVQIRLQSFDWFLEIFVLSCWSSCNQPVCVAVWQKQHPQLTDCPENTFTISVGPTCTGWILGGLRLSWSRLRRILSFGICVLIWKINRRFGAVVCSHSPPRRWRHQILSKSEWIPTGRRGAQSQNFVFLRWVLLAAFPVRLL
jgi:hypothetical protein